MDGDPCAWEDGDEATPHNIPDHPAVPQVGTMIGVQQVGVDGWYRAGVNRGSLKQVVDEEEKHLSIL